MNTERSQATASSIDHWFQLQHRRLRERFSMETLTRNERRLGQALQLRHKAVRRG